MNERTYISLSQNTITRLLIRKEMYFPTLANASKVGGKIQTLMQNWDLIT